MAQTDALPANTNSGDLLSNTPAMPVVLRAEHFDPLVGRGVRFGGTDVALVLVAVDRQRGSYPAALPRAPFVLVFSGSRVDKYLPEGFYTCDFGDGAVFDIHVSPIATFAADRQDYQAIFN